jgi:predicted nucleic acid-binding protein
LGLIVLDTSVLIDHLRRNQDALDAMVRADERGHVAAVSVVSRIELLAGMRSDERHSVHRLFETVRWLDVTINIAQRAGEHARHFRRSHPGIAMADFVIGATAETLGAELWTTNVRHFPMFPKLAAPY